MKLFRLLFFGSSLIGAIVLLIIAWNVYPQTLWRGLTFGTVLWLSGSYLIFYIYSKHKQQQLAEQPIRQKILELQNKGTSLHREEQRDLTVADRRKLEASIRNTILFIIILIGVSIGIVFFITNQEIPAIIAVVM